MVEFKIGGVIFRTKAEIVEEFPETLFAMKLGEVAVAAAVQSVLKRRDSLITVELKGPGFESPELFPLVFDFLLRCYKFKFGRQSPQQQQAVVVGVVGEVSNSSSSAFSNDEVVAAVAPPPPALRAVRLNHRQSNLLDEIEKRVFGIEQQQQFYDEEVLLWADVKTVELTGSRYYINHEKGTVCVAVPPLGVEGVPNSMCIDPLVVHLVLKSTTTTTTSSSSRQNSKKKSRSTVTSTENQSIIISTLRRRYPAILINGTTDSYFRLWNVVDIPRGEPFVLRRNGGGSSSGCGRGGDNDNELVVDLFFAGDCDVLLVA